MYLPHIVVSITIFPERFGVKFYQSSLSIIIITRGAFSAEYRNHIPYSYSSQKSNTKYEAPLIIYVAWKYDTVVCISRVSNDFGLKVYDRRIYNVSEMRLNRTDL